MTGVVKAARLSLSACIRTFPALQHWFISKNAYYMDVFRIVLHVRNLEQENLARRNFVVRRPRAHSRRVAAFERLGLAEPVEGSHIIMGVAYDIDYQPMAGIRSQKAERLVQYCLGDYAEQPIPACTANLDYTAPRAFNNPALFCIFQKGELSLWRKEPANANSRGVMDHKRIAEAWITQHAEIPKNLRCWLVRGDGAGRRTDPEQGPHLAAVRDRQYSHLILVPGSNRERYLGHNLEQQMMILKDAWVPWGEKRDAAWWGGDATGNCKFRSYILSRYRFLRHYHDEPSDKVVIHLTSTPSRWPREAWRGRVPDPKGKFEKHDAFSHKCIVLLKGHDAPSGLSWTFGGNSVVMMQPPVVDHILYFELEPWVHYVPLQPHPEDVLTKLNWVLENQDAAQKIVRRAHEHLSWFTGPEYLWACNEVLRRVASGQDESLGLPNTL